MRQSTFVYACLLAFIFMPLWTRSADALTNLLTNPSMETGDFTGWQTDAPAQSIIGQECV